LAAGDGPRGAAGDALAGPTGDAGRPGDGSTGPAGSEATGATGATGPPAIGDAFLVAQRLSECNVLPASCFAVVHGGAATAGSIAEYRSNGSFALPAEFTLEFWYCYTMGLDKSLNTRIVELADAVSDISFFRIRISELFGNSIYNITGGSSANTDAKPGFNFRGLFYDQWHHVVLLATKATEWRVFHNGVPSAVFAASSQHSENLQLHADAKERRLPTLLLRGLRASALPESRTALHEPLAAVQLRERRHVLLVFIHKDAGRRRPHEDIRRA
jgi:hypothetical protein